MANSIITELVVEKPTVRKAYNYYNAKRDKEQYEHLEKNYGIGTPTSVEFIPLIRRHIDALVGEYLTIPKKPKVSCKDEKTLNNIYRDKQIQITEEVINEFKNRLNQAILDVMYHRKQLIDQSIDSDINIIKEQLERNFTSEYEIASQNIIMNALQSRELDLENKLKILFTDLVITGMCFFRVIKTKDGKGIDIQVLSTMDTFVESTLNKTYVKHSQRAVVRRWLTKVEILTEFGDNLDKKALEELESLFETSSFNSYTYFTTMMDRCGTPIPTSSIYSGYGVHPEQDENWHYYNWRYIPIYEVEWITTNKENKTFVMERYEAVRIGETIMIPIGRDENVIRSVSNPDFCYLKTNGVYFKTRSGEPYSLVNITSNLQDRYICPV